jgi:hypothetical protein
MGKKIIEQYPIVFFSWAEVELRLPRGRTIELENLLSAALLAAIAEAAAASVERQMSSSSNSGLVDLYDK